MLFRYKLLSALGAATLSVPACAAPVFLNCTLTNGSRGDFKMDVQLNEEGGSVSYAFPDSGVSFTETAIFAPGSVAFGAFSISRIDLTIQRNNAGLPVEEGHQLPLVDRGKCLIDARKRAF